MTNRKLVPIMLTVIGVIGEAYALLTINADKTNFWGGYTYTPPFTSHEITYISIASISAVSVIIGLFLLLSNRKIDK